MPNNKRRNKMKYLVKKYLGQKPVLLAQSKDPRKVLYVADTHTFDLKGKQLVSLTDLKDYAQGFSLEEATDFVKLHKEFIIEDPEDYEDEFEDEEEEEHE
jgi:hypothetical protein